MYEKSNIHPGDPLPKGNIALNKNIYVTIVYMFYNITCRLFDLETDYNLTFDNIFLILVNVQEDSINKYYIPLTHNFFRVIR